MTAGSLAPQRRCINITFHGVGPRLRALDPGEDRVWLSSERFTSILDAVAGRRDVRISFDDGNASDAHVALPALCERGLTATFFVVAGRLGHPGFLSADDVTRLAHQGMRIGSHGMRHRSWRRLDDVDLLEELFVARLLLEDVVSRPVREAAIPFGAYDRRVLKEIRGHNYERVYTSDSGPARPDRWLQPRSSLQAHDTPAQLERLLSTGGSTWQGACRRAKSVVKRWR